MIEINRKNIRVWSMLGMRRMIGPVMKDIIERNDKVIFATADLGRYFAYEEVLRTFPDNVVELGIAEQNLIGASAGLQNEGFNVFAASYATFITARALDQIRVNIGYMGFGIKLIGGGGGLCDGNFSATHMALEDISNTRNIPNIMVLAPADGMELIKVLTALSDFDGPAYVRLSGRANMPIIYREDYEFQFGKAVMLREGNEITIIANGTILGEALKTAEKIESNNISCRVINMHTIKPLDKDILRAIADCKLVVTVEEHFLPGGMGSAIAEFYAEEKIKPMMLMLSVGTSYPDAAEYEDLLIKCGLTRDDMADKILSKYKLLM